MERTVQGLSADVAAAVSGTGATFTWVAQVNDLLQLVATLIAIVAGIYAARWHRLRIKLAKEKANASGKRIAAGRTTRTSGGKSSGGSETTERK